MIHIGGKPLPDSRKKCFYSIINNLGDGDSIHIITDCKKWSRSKNIKWIKYSEYLKHSGDKVKEIISHLSSKFGRNDLISDIIRIDYLSKVPNVLYLDTDVYLINRPKLDRMSFAKLGSGRNADWAIFNSSDTDKFGRILYSLSISNPRTHRHLHNLNADEIKVSDALHMRGNNG